MNTKDTVILLMLLLAITGLVIGIYYSEDVSSDSTHHSSYSRVYEDSDGVLTVTLEKSNQSDFSKYFT